MKFFHHFLFLGEHTEASVQYISPNGDNNTPKLRKHSGEMITKISKTLRDLDLYFERNYDSLVVKNKLSASVDNYMNEHLLENSSPIVKSRIYQYQEVSIYYYFQSNVLLLILFRSVLRIVFIFLSFPRTLMQRACIVFALCYTPLLASPFPLHSLSLTFSSLAGFPL